MASKTNSLHLSLPATSANLGPAFDAAALAMDFYLELDARRAANFSISASGRDREICGKVQDHLILSTYREVLEAAGAEVVPLALRLKNDIPIGKGCGSSAAARIAGIALAVHFAGLRWNDAQIVGEASRREHHPDNASACWWGGLTVARMSGAAEAQVISVRPKGKWPLLPCLQPLAGTEGILGAVLSGAGPSVLIFLNPGASAKKARRLVAAHLARHGLRAELLFTAIAPRGARGSKV
jgi:homoserine kinase